MGLGLIITIIVCGCLLVAGGVTAFVVTVTAKSRKNDNNPTQEVENEKEAEKVDEPAEEPAEEVAQEPAEEEPEEAEAPAEEVKEEVEAPAAEEEVAQAAEQPAVEEIENSTEEEDDEEEEKVVSLNVGGNQVKVLYRKSFTARLIQSKQQTKEFYAELVNYVESYGLKGRVSWNFNTYRKGRNQLFKFNVRGKTLCMYFALNADDYERTTYHLEDVEAKRYEKTPSVYRVKSGLAVRRCKELVDFVCAKYAISRGEEKAVTTAEDYPYDTTENLIKRELIKYTVVDGVLTDDSELVSASVADILNGKEEPAEEPAEEVAEELVEEPEEVVEEPEEVAAVAESEEEEEEETAEAEEEEDKVVAFSVNGNEVKVLYRKSFMARLLQSPDATKQKYVNLKNHADSYPVKGRVSWNYDSYHYGRNQLFKFNVRGKTLCMYFAAEVEEFIEKGYRLEKVETKKYEKTPYMFRVKSGLSERRCKELIDFLCAKYALLKGEEKEGVALSDYPYDTTEHLITRELIKYTVISGEVNEDSKLVSASIDDLMREKVTAEEAHSLLTDSQAESLIITEEEAKAREEAEEREKAEKEALAKAEEAAIAEEEEEEPLDEFDEYYAQEEEEPAVEEKPQVTKKPAYEPKPFGLSRPIIEEVEPRPRYRRRKNEPTQAKKSGGKKAVVNVDVLSRKFSAGDSVNLQSLKKMGLVPAGTGEIKILARGTLDKPLKVTADDFSADAVKMIVLTGGTAIKRQK